MLISSFLPRVPRDPVRPARGCKPPGQKQRGEAERTQTLERVPHDPIREGQSWKTQVTFESGGQRLGYGEEEPGFSRASPHLPGGGPAPGAAALEDPGMGWQVWEKPSWMKRCLLLPKARGASGAYSGAAAAPLPIPLPDVCGLPAGPAPGRRPGRSIPGRCGLVSVEFRVEMAGHRAIEPSWARHPSFLRIFLPRLLFQPAPPAGLGGGGRGEGPKQNKQTKPAAQSSGPGGALRESLSDKRRTGNTPGFRAIEFNQHLLSASPGRGAGDPETHELRARPRGKFRVSSAMSPRAHSGLPTNWRDAGTEKRSELTVEGCADTSPHFKWT